MALGRNVRKALILGDSKTGKTSLMCGWITKGFRDRPDTTMWVNFRNVEVALDHGETTTLQIWDTPGMANHQESLPLAFYDGVELCVLVFDVTSRQSFTSLDKWRQEFLTQARDALKLTPSKQRSPESVPIMVLGTKYDMPLRLAREFGIYTVGIAEIQTWCKERGCHYQLTSCRDNWNVKRALETIARNALPMASVVKPSRFPVTDETFLRLHACYAELLTSGLGSDFTLISADERHFAVHRCILQARSEVFRAMLMHSCKETDTGQCRLLNIQGDVLEVLLKYLYCGDTQKVAANAVTLLSATDQYNLPDLKALCVSELLDNISAVNCGAILTLAEMHQIPELKDAAVGFLTAINFEDFFGPVPEPSRS